MAGTTQSWPVRADRTNINRSTLATIVVVVLLVAAGCDIRPTPEPPPGGSKPADVLDLADWKLTLPVDAAAEIQQPELATFSDPAHFAAAGDAVVFTAEVGGDTTSGSEYPRSELREMNGSDKASWSSSSNSSRLHVAGAVAHLPAVKAQVVVGQIHNADDDIVEILADGTKGRAANPRLMVRWKGTSQPDPVLASVSLGERFTFDLVAGDGRIKIYGNGTLTHTFSYSGSGLYFKAGAYTQSNPDKGDDPADYGQTRITELTVAHG